MSNLKNQIAEIPRKSGVYLFKDKVKRVLYVGKATNLRSRIGSYFQGREAGRLIGSFVRDIASIETKETKTVLEALILEANLIKKYQPRYNVLGKDDKSFSYFVITNEKFPRVVVWRETELKKNGDTIQKVFGPYTSKRQMEIALKIMRKIFPFHSRRQETEQGCFDFQIGLCPGPYTGEITRKDYLKNILGIKMILSGKMKKLIGKMENEMQAFSKKEEFEKAAELRNKIFALKHIQDVALISSDDVYEKYGGEEKSKKIRIEAYDISNISGEYATGSMVVFEGTEPNKSEYRKFKIRTITGSNDVGMMREVLLRRFSRKWNLPDLILLDGGIGHLSMGAEFLHGLNIRISIVAVAKGPDRKNTEIKKLESNFNQRIASILEDKKLIKKIMDEAHRFAVAYHRKLRSSFLKK